MSESNNRAAAQYVTSDDTDLLDKQAEIVMVF